MGENSPTLTKWAQLVTKIYTELIYKDYKYEYMMVVHLTKNYISIIKR